MNILGISALFHDSAAALVQDGRIVAAAQEERFTRIKHDAAFPRQAVAYCLQAGGIDAARLDHVIFYEKPLLKFERLLETYVAFAPRGFASFAQAMPSWLKEKLRTPAQIDRELGGAFGGRYLFCAHHEAHAASAFYPSPFASAAVLTIDGVGEWATSTIGRGRGASLELLLQQNFPHSLGLLYSACTYYAGFRVNSGEYKVMGLAPYGTPRFAGLILEKIVRLEPDGSFQLDQSYFNYCQGLTMTSARWHALFGRPPRAPESRLDQFTMDLAASVQAVTEQIVLQMARHAHAVTGEENLVLAGGVALNCVANGRLLREGPFRRIWIQPAAGDAGGALGAALLVWHQLLGSPRRPRPGDSQEGSLLGPEFSPAEIRSALEGAGVVFTECATFAETCGRTAALLAGGAVVAWFQGRMEFGPRALGSRSILGDPRRPEMQSTMNLKIKFRESFRPFAPAVLAPRAADYFAVEPGTESPYMLLVAPVRAGHRLPAPDYAGGERWLEQLATPRSTIPAVTHVDFSARIQTVDAGHHPHFHALLEAFAAQTGCPLLINTSFNVRGEPVVATPAQACRCFLATGMDALVIGNFIAEKSAQRPAAQGARTAEYLAQYQLD